jgi:hypothetical protein
MQRKVIFCWKFHMGKVFMYLNQIFADLDGKNASKMFLDKYLIILAMVIYEERNYALRTTQFSAYRLIQTTCELE